MPAHFEGATIYSIVTVWIVFPQARTEASILFYSNDGQTEDSGVGGHKP